MASRTKAETALKVAENAVTEKKNDRHHYIAQFMEGENYESDDDKKAFTRKTMTEILEYFNVPKVHGDKEFTERTEQYFMRCVERGIKPTVEEWAMALGVHRQTIWDWETGKNRSVSSDVVKRAKEVLSAFDAKAVTEGKMFPTTYIFRSKNYYGLKDQQDVVVTPNQLETRAKEELIEAAAELPDD